MKYLLEVQRIADIGVVGTGTAALRIAALMAQSLSPYGVGVTLVGPSKEAVTTARQGVERTLAASVESGKMKEKVRDGILSALTFTSDMGSLSGAGLVVGAACHDLKSARATLGQLDGVCPSDCILAMNATHLEPDTIFKEAARPERCLVVHFHTPADRNPVIEVLSTAKTDPQTTAWMMQFLEQMGKIPIEVGARVGHAIRPVTDGLALAAMLLVQEGVAEAKVVDAVAARALGMKTGPLAALNTPGDMAHVARGIDRLNTLSPWYAVPDLLVEMVKESKAWDVAEKGEENLFDDEQFNVISRQMLGAYFGLVTQVLESGITSISDLELAITSGAGMTGPFDLMNREGLLDALEMVKGFAARHPGFAIAESLERQAAMGKNWEIPVVLRRDVDSVAVITIRRPKALNALNKDVLDQLKAHFHTLAGDEAIKAVVLTGFGPTAFVAGADITELARVKGSAEGEQVALRGQAVFSTIENLRKPVVCALNGLAFGGGNELAMSCHARLARKGARVLAGQPEPKLGLIPGYGGTQRLVRLIGLEKAWPILRLGEPISSDEALEMGLIREEVAGDLLQTALELATKAGNDKVDLIPISRGPISVPDTLPELDLGHLSTRIDQIMQDAILSGAMASLDTGLKMEAVAFGACFETKDARIGLENFITNGPRAKAEFVNE